MSPIRFPDERIPAERIMAILPELRADNAIAQVATGVGKAVEGLISFPDMALQYIIGATRHLGEQASWSQIGRRFSGDYFDDPATRTTEVITHMIFGTLDLISGHLLHRTSETLGIQHYTPFFSAPPTTIEGWATDVTSIGFLFALPAAAKSLKSSLGIPAQPIAVSETALFNELSEAAARAEWQAMVARAQARMAELAEARTQAARSPHHFNTWMREGQGAWGSQRGAIGWFTESQVSALIAQLRRPLHDSVAAINLIDLIKDPQGPLRSLHITQLLEVVRPVRVVEPSPASNVLYNVSIYKPQLFLQDHIAPLLAMAAHEPRAYYINYTIEMLANHRPELFTPQHVAHLREVAWAGDSTTLNNALASLAARNSKPALTLTSSQTPHATDAALVDAVEMELRDLLARPSSTQTISRIPGQVQVAEALGISPDLVGNALEGIGRLSQQGLAILMRCQADTDFRTTLIAALQQMQKEATGSTWLAEALKQVQKSADTKPDLEI